MHLVRLLGSKLSIGAALVACLGGGTAVVVHFADGSPSHSTQVLGENFVISGAGNGNAGNSSNTKPAKEGNASNNNGNPAPGKAFTITGSLTGLFPGVASKLYLTVANPNNQAMTVTNLTATVTSVTKATNAPAGSCTATAANLVIQSFTGPSFAVPANSSRSSSPAYIPVLTPLSAANACQGATFTLTYAGTGTQA